MSLASQFDSLLVPLYLPESSKDEKDTPEPEIKSVEGLDSDDNEDSNNGKGAGSTVRKHSYTLYSAITVLSIVFYRSLSY